MANILVLCTGNSARSIIGEVLINDLGNGAHTAFSAGSHPTGQDNPGALQKLSAEGHSIDGLTSKSWDEFAGDDAPEMDIIITVCDSAAGEPCPIWNGSPVTVHWGIPDPAYFDDEEAREAAFDLAYARLRQRIEAMLALPSNLTAADLRRSLEQVHAAARAADIADV